MQSLRPADLVLTCNATIIARHIESIGSRPWQQSCFSTSPRGLQIQMYRISITKLLKAPVSHVDACNNPVAAMDCLLAMLGHLMRLAQGSSPEALKSQQLFNIIGHAPLDFWKLLVRREEGKERWIQQLLWLLLMKVVQGPLWMLRARQRHRQGACCIPLRLSAGLCWATCTWSR